MFQIAINQYLTTHSYDSFSLKAVLFDMDGVLFDSMPNHAYARHKAMAASGLHMSTEEAFLHEGRTGAGTINLICQREWGRDATQEEISWIYEEKSREFNLCPQARPMPGALELLTQVKESGLTPMLVTGSGQSSLLERLNHHFPGMFSSERMITASDVRYGKPHPEPYLMALSKGNLKPSEAIVIENAPLGVQAASAAGIFTIGVNTGPLPSSVLREAGADLLFPSMPALCQAWKELFVCLH